MYLLRRIPLSRLLVLCAVGVIAVAAGALAAAGGHRRQPARAPLAAAIRQALAAKPVPGVTATVSFTDNLLAGAGLDAHGRPLLNGGSGRLWASASGRVHLELQSDAGDTEIYFDRGTVSYFDSSSSTLYHVTLPQGQTGQSANPDTQPHALPTVADIQTTLQSLMQHAGVSGAQPSNVAGQPAYRVEITPRDGGLVGGVALWWDAVHGTPLSIAVYAAHNNTPVLQLTATDITYTSVKSWVFVPPKASKTVDLKVPALPAGTHPAAGRHARAHHAQATTVQALRSALGVPVSAPASLGGLAQTGSELVHWGGKPAALLTYGQGLGGIAVLEQQTSRDTGAKTNPTAPSGAGADGQNQSLPTVKINGAPGTELSTPLGSFVRFTRGKVTYTLLGSVRGSTVLAAARSL